MKVKHSTTNFKALEPFLKVVEENDGYKDEQGREEIGEIGHEVGVVVEDDGLDWGIVGRKL